MKDISLIPNQSAWFGFTTKNGNPLPLESTNIYRNNRLGLQDLIEEGKLLRIESPHGHLELDKDWFREKIIPILREK